ncbi:MAG TPA: TldD/PmbA family protein [Acidimicrobiales bacterium]|nr:TldD/PmbA family protein [Acidimicrobiales bacterium]
MSELLDLARRVAEQAKPGEQVEAYVARSKRVAVRAYQGEVEALTSAESSGIGVRVIVDKRVGFAHAGTLDEGAIAEALSEARDNAEFGEVDEWNALAVPDGVVPPELDLYRPELASFPTDRKVELALELERATLAGDPRITGVRTSSYGDAAGEAAIATSTGIAVSSRATSCWLTVHALASEDGEVQWGYGIDVGRTQDELDIAATAADGVERATRMLGAKQPKSQRLTVVLDPRVAASFLSIVGNTLTGERVLKGRSPFADRMGDAIAAPALTLVDDATNPESLGADSHDGEGLATRPSVLIEGGTLTTFLQNSYTARRSGTVSTGSAVRGYSSRPGVGCLALIPTPGTLSAEALYREIGEGLLVQEVTGLHSGVNPVSGDFSVGAEGVMIRDGALAEPVREMTIASTLQRMLLDIVAVGGDLEWLPGGDAGLSLAIGDVALSGS